PETAGGSAPCLAWNGGVRIRQNYNTAVDLRLLFTSKNEDIVQNESRGRLTIATTPLKKRRRVSIVDVLALPTSVAKRPCLVCGRRPADAHHLRFAQPLSGVKRTWLARVAART